MKAKKLITLIISAVMACMILASCASDIDTGDFEAEAPSGWGLCMPTIDGKEQTVIAKGDTQDVMDALGNTQSQIEVLSLTDPNAAVHIQNISQYREDLLRWFWNIYGMDSRGTSKRAQQSVEEVDQGGDLSMVIPMSRWRARQEEVEQVRAKCGATEASCDFSTCWKSRIMEAVTIDDETAEELDVENIVNEKAEAVSTEASADAESEEINEGEEEESNEESETV